MRIQDDLLRPEAYGAIPCHQVTLMETHISWVFVLDRDVFKIKKPVDLGFLDFRTLEQRRAACEAEVRLNTRLAPDVYLDVAPIHRAHKGRASLVGSGPIIDWAVHMRRMPDERRASSLLARGALSAFAIDALAKRIAKFHAEASRSDGDRYGSVDAITVNIDENFRQTRATLSDYLSSDEADEITRWQSSFLRGHAELFTQRIAHGRVVEGHGDLRLEHVYFDDASNPTVLDCIEFNERFRISDVCSDVAFLAMDLVEHGRADLGERFLADYARETNDYDLYALVDFYASYRAFVRGKIAAMLAGDADANEETRASARQEARRYFRLALSADRPSLLLPAVIAVGGVIASGKSTIAEALSDEIGAPIVDTDRTRKSMLGVEATDAVYESAWQGAYAPSFTDEVYREVLRRAGVVLASGRPVILDASFRSAKLRAAARELADTHNVPFRFVECRADSSLCYERLAARETVRGVSDGRSTVFEAFRAGFEAVTDLCQGEHIVIQTAAPLAESMRTLEARLDTWPVGFVA